MVRAYHVHPTRPRCNQCGLLFTQAQLEIHARRCDNNRRIAIRPAMLEGSLSKLRQRLHHYAAILASRHVDPGDGLLGVVMRCEAAQSALEAHRGRRSIGGFIPVDMPPLVWRVAVPGVRFGEIERLRVSVLGTVARLEREVLGAWRAVGEAHYRAGTLHFGAARPVDDAEWLEIESALREQSAPNLGKVVADVAA